MRIRAKIITKNYEIEERRKKLGYSQIDFAEILGMTIARFALIESLKVKPTETEARSISLELDTPIAVLFPRGYEKLVDIFRKPIQSIADYTPPLLENDEQLLLNQVNAEITVKNLIKVLPEKERRMIEIRNGIGVNRQYTLDEAGRELGVTRERARQIEAKGLERMRQKGIKMNIKLSDI